MLLSTAFTTSDSQRLSYDWHHKPRREPYDHSEPSDKYLSAFFSKKIPGTKRDYRTTLQDNFVFLSTFLHKLEMEEDMTPFKKRKTDIKQKEELPSIRHLLANIDSVYFPPPIMPLFALLKVISEPDTWQISNYNVQPILTIELPKDMSESVIKVELMANNCFVTMGFLAASTQVVSRNCK